MREPPGCSGHTLSVSGICVSRLIIVGTKNGVGYAFAFDWLTEALRAELWNCDLAGAESRRCEHGGKIGNVKNWRRMQIDAAFRVIASNS